MGGKGSGNFEHSGRKGEVGGSTETPGEAKVRNERSLRALKAFVPTHAGSQRHAENNELVIRKMVGGVRTKDNLPVDVITTIEGKVKGIEVKTLVNNSNDKITMRKGALEKKNLWGKSNHASVHTVVIDDRGKLGNAGYGGHRIYYRKGSGSFRLVGMTKVRDAAHLKDLLAGRGMRSAQEVLLESLGGPGSGNFGHSGRPGEVGGSGDDSISAAPLRPEPTVEQIREIHRLAATGMAHTTIATQMQMGGKSGSRGQITKDIVAKYNPDGTKKDSLPPTVVILPRTPTPPIVEPIPSGPKGELTNTNTWGETTWYAQGNKAVNVLVGKDIDHQTQMVVQTAVSRMPGQVLDAARNPQFQVVPEILIAHAFGGQSAGWNAAGQYQHGQRIDSYAGTERTRNQILVATKGMDHTYMEKVVAHELGHGLEYNSMRLFGVKEVREAYKADRHDIVVNKNGSMKESYKKFAYYRSNRHEAFAESVAQHLVPGYRQVNSQTPELYRAAFPRMMAVVGKGLERVMSKKVK